MISEKKDKAHNAISDQWVVFHCQMNGPSLASPLTFPKKYCMNTFQVKEPFLNPTESGWRLLNKLLCEHRLLLMESRCFFGLITWRCCMFIKEILILATEIRACSVSIRDLLEQEIISRKTLDSYNKATIDMADKILDILIDELTSTKESNSEVIFPDCTLDKSGRWVTIKQSTSSQK